MTVLGTDRACIDGRSDEAVADASLGLDAIGTAGLLDLRANPAHIHPQVVVRPRGVRSPDTLQQHLMGQDVAGVSGKVVQELELHWREVDRSAAYDDAAV